VQASATTYEAIEFYRERYGIQRAVLPRVLTLPQVGQLSATRAPRSRSSASAACA
jgi:collagenase-like PrtC family protease